MAVSHGSNKIPLTFETGDFQFFLMSIILSCVQDKGRIMFIFIIRRKKYKKFYTPFKIYKSIVIVQEIIRSLLTTYIKTRSLEIISIDTCYVLSKINIAIL